MNILDLTGIKERLDNGYYSNNKPWPRKTEAMKDGYITDENQSVKWNKEQVELARQKYKQYQDEYNEEENRVENLFRQDIIDYIVNHHSFTPKAAAIIFNKAYEEGHSDGYNGILTYIYDYLCFASEIVEANKKVIL